MNKDDLLSELERVAGAEDQSHKELSKNYLKTTAELDGVSKDSESKELEEYVQFLEQKNVKNTQQKPVTNDSVAEPAPKDAKPKPEQAAAPVKLDKKQEKLNQKAEQERIRLEKIAEQKRAKEEKLAEEKRKKAEAIAEKERIKSEKKAAKDSAKKDKQSISQSQSQSRYHRNRPDAEELRHKVEALLATRKTPEQRRQEINKQLDKPELPSTPALIVEPGSMNRGIRTHMGIIRDMPTAPGEIFAPHTPVLEANEEAPAYYKPVPVGTLAASAPSASLGRARASVAEPQIKEAPVKTEPLIEKAPVEIETQFEHFPEEPAIAQTLPSEQTKPVVMKPVEQPKKAEPIVVRPPKEPRKPEKIDKKQQKEDAKAEKQRQKEEAEAAKKRAIEEKKQAVENQKRQAEEAKRLKKERKQGNSILIPEAMKDDALAYIFRHPIWAFTTIVLVVMNVMLIRIIMQILGS